MRKGLSKGRIQRYIHTFKEMKELGVDLENLNEKEIDKYYFWLMNSDQAQWTKVTKWRCFKKICRFVNKDIDFSEWAVKIPKTEPEILSLREISAIVENLPSFRDKLLVLLLYESGARIGEILNLRRGDVTFDEYGAKLRLKGKTGTRYIRVVKTARFLEAWVELNKSDRLFELSNQRVCQILKEAAKKAGIKKRVHPHLFRHTRATHLAKYLTEPELKVYFGWSKDSRMPAIYVHLSGRDVDDKILQIAQAQDLLALPTKYTPAK